MPDLGDAAIVASQLRRHWGVEPVAPLDLDLICRRLGVESKELALGASTGGAQGFLIPRQGGFRIEIDPEPRCGWSLVPAPARTNLRRHRQRFLLCHELAHTVFYESGPDRPRRVVPDSAQQEAFCDELARSLLVPQEAAAALPLSPESVSDLQRRFDVSMEIAFRSAVSAHRDAAGWLLLQRDGETRIQWTSVGQRTTAKALATLRSLAGHAARVGRAATRMPGSPGLVEALFLGSRDQVIVTLDRSVSG